MSRGLASEKNIVKQDSTLLHRKAKSGGIYKNYLSHDAETKQDLI